MTHKAFAHCNRCGHPVLNTVSEREFVCERCAYRHFITPFPAACALLLDADNRILLIRRGHEPGLDLLCVPGGVIEGGETAEEAVSRETREEVGLDIPASEFSYFTSLPNRYPFQGYTWPTLDLFYLARVPSFAGITPQASEVAGWEIRPLAEVDFSEFAFESNAEAIRRLHQKKICQKPFAADSGRSVMFG